MSSVLVVLGAWKAGIGYTEMPGLFGMEVREF